MRRPRTVVLFICNFRQHTKEVAHWAEEEGIIPPAASLQGDSAVPSWLHAIVVGRSALVTWLGHEIVELLDAIADRYIVAATHTYSTPINRLLQLLQ